MSAIQVSIYDDRLEVDSTGMLYDGLNVKEALSGKSKCPNSVENNNAMVYNISTEI
ncbi:MAG: hypothetical protein IJS61_08000 [Firmicutes bacterium]|nr:hypothetical protein [Bacillota bacterium]